MAEKPSVPAGMGRLLLWYIPERIFRVPTYFFMAIHSFFLKRVIAILTSKNQSYPS
jgi:hypothetical protein